jgi:GT2 family glycosyltransferase
LRQEPTELAEFHCMLMLTKVCHRLGPFDERLLSMHEHEDVCLAVRSLGGTVYFEPRSVVTYVPPSPLTWLDFPYFMLRWSEAWNSASHRHFERKWRLGNNDKSMSLARDWARDHRWMRLKLIRGAARRFCRLCGWPPNRIEQAVLFPPETRISNWVVRFLSKDAHKRAISDP